jgi:hypothetical protein
LATSRALLSSFFARFEVCWFGIEGVLFEWYRRGIFSFMLISGPASAELIPTPHPPPANLERSLGSGWRRRRRLRYEH